MVMAQKGRCDLRVNGMTGLFPRPTLAECGHRGLARRRVTVRRRARYAAGGGGGGFGGLGGGGLGGLNGKMAMRKVKRVLVVLMSAFSTRIRIGLEEKTLHLVPRLA